MMTLPERLRLVGKTLTCTPRPIWEEAVMTMTEAADEIERLRSLLGAARSVLQRFRYCEGQSRDDVDTVCDRIDGKA